MAKVDEILGVTISHTLRLEIIDRAIKLVAVRNPSGMAAPEFSKVFKEAVQLITETMNEI